MSPTHDHELVAISFSREVHLNTANLLTTKQHILSRQGSCSVSAAQVVVNDDPEYVELLSSLHTRIDTVADDAYF